MPSFRTTIRALLVVFSLTWHIVLAAQERGPSSSSQINNNDEIVNVLSNLQIPKPEGEYTKLDSTLFKLVPRFDEQGNLTAPLDTVIPQDVLTTDAITLIIDIVGTPGTTTSTLRTALEEELGLEVTGCFRLVEGSCSVKCPVDMIPDVARLVDVAGVFSNMMRINSQGAVASKGDESMFADDARTTFGVTGAGVTVGVLSDSYNSCTRSGGCVTNAADDVSSGDLPPTSRITILQDFFGSNTLDEGRAMMQLVYDISPGVDFIFQTAFNGLSAFADSIIALADAQCDVIVEDVLYFEESMFQDDLIAIAANEASSRGISMLSAAGNNADKSYEADYTEVEINGFFFHSFQGVNDPFFPVNATAGTRAVLQWDDPTLTTSGGQSPLTNLDLFLFEGANVLRDTSVADNPSNGRPFETVVWPETTVLNLAVSRVSGPAPGRVKIVFFDGDVETSSIPLGESTIYGHANAEGVMGVAAAAFPSTPGFGTSPAIAQRFSSLGDTQILFDENGNRLGVPARRLSPAFTGPDGTCNTFLGTPNALSNDPGCFNFFGTSAAAPSAAGVVALMLGAAPQLSPAQARSFIVNTAQDMDNLYTPAFDVGFDFHTGAGFVNALRAVEQAVIFGGGTSTTTLPTTSTTTTQTSTTSSLPSTTTTAQATTSTTVTTLPSTATSQSPPITTTTRATTSRPTNPTPPRTTESPNLGLRGATKAPKASIRSSKSPKASRRRRSTRSPASQSVRGGMM